MIYYVSAVPGLPTTFTASELESEYGGVSLEPVTYDLTMLDSRE